MGNTQAAHSVQISVVIPVYNNARWIRRAVDSVLQQTRRADEIIVVNDGSTDQTGEILLQYGDAIQVIRQENAGPSAARNRGIRAARFAWIAFLDSDDQWLPEKLALQTEHLGRHPDLQWTTANYFRCLCAESIRRPDLDKPVPQEVLPDYLQSYRAGFTGHTDTMLIRKDLLEAAGGFREGQHRLEDLDLWLRIAYRQPRIGYLSSPLAIHHLQAGEHTTSAYSIAPVCGELLRRHMDLSAQAGRAEVFGPLAGYLLRRWMRGMLFDARRAGEVRQLAKQFSALLSAKDRIIYSVLPAFPKLTETVLRGISKIVRGAGLRRRAERPPAAKAKEETGNP